MNRRLTWLSLTLLLVGGLGLPTLTQLSACGEVGTHDERYINYELFVPASGETGDKTARDQLIEDLDEADETIHVATTTLDDPGVIDALIAARDRGVEISMVADADFQDVEGMETLEEARITPTYGDGELEYLPDFFLAQVLAACQTREDEKAIVCSSNPAGDQGEVVRPGDFNLMSDNMFVIDEHVTWNFTLPLDGREAHPIAWRATGNDFSLAYVREIEQMHGGTFATTLTTFSGPLKSINDMHTEYHTSTGPIEVRFNPQERLIKEVIDEIYSAHASVYVMSDNIMNPFVLEALEYKDSHDFEVQIVVNDAEQATGSSRDRLEAMDATFVDRPDGTVPTVLIIDSEADDRGRTAIVLSHPLVRGAPFEVERPQPVSCAEGPQDSDTKCDDLVYIYPSDKFYDGNIWMLDEYGQKIGKRPQIDQLLDYWKQVKQQ